MLPHKHPLPRRGFFWEGGQGLTPAGCRTRLGSSHVSTWSQPTTSRVLAANRQGWHQDARSSSLLAPSLPLAHRTHLPMLESRRPALVCWVVNRRAFRERKGQRSCVPLLSEGRCRKRPRLTHLDHASKVLSPQVVFSFQIQVPKLTGPHRVVLGVELVKAVKCLAAL